jgi:hypothetical protein
MRWIPGPLALLAAVGCSSTDSDHSSIPPEAAALQNYVHAGVRITIPRLAGVEARLPFLLSQGSAGAGGLVFQPDPAPGAPPNAYLFTIPVDGDNDGLAEVTLDGSAVFNGDPAQVGVGFGGHLDFTTTMAAGLGDFTGAMDFSLAANGDRVISGSGTLTESVTGNVTAVHVDPATPITMRAAAGTANTQANACAYSLDGTVGLEVTGSQGVLSSDWTFTNTSRNVAVTNASFTDGSKTTQLPNTSITIPCGGNGTLSDWNGSFLQNWACFPPEFGQAMLTLAKTGSSISISDEDPPGSGQSDTYSASPVPGNPHVIRGFFIGGPPGSTYREDFSWTLSSNGNAFSQISYYVYQEGPSIGTGGLCAGQAVRQP